MANSPLSMKAIRVCKVRPEFSIYLALKGLYSFMIILLGSKLLLQEQLYRFHKVLWPPYKHANACSYDDVTGQWRRLYFAPSRTYLTPYSVVSWYAVNNLVGQRPKRGCWKPCGWVRTWVIFASFDAKVGRELDLVEVFADEVAVERPDGAGLHRREPDALWN